MNIFAQNRTLFLVEGILFIILGLLAIALPQFTTLAVELFIGWLFLIGGVVQFFRAFKARDNGFWPTILGSILYIIVGALMLFYPLQGILSLTLLLTIFFFIDGIAKIVLAFQYRNLPNWGWIFVSGLLSLGIALIIWSGWPGTAAWIIGLMAGINMLFFGITLLTLLSLTNKKV